MSDYIDRQAALDAISEACFELRGVYGRCEDALNALPSAEVEPVKRGKWEKKPDPYGFFDEIPVCSICGHTNALREQYPYCPWCGAKMAPFSASSENGQEVEG